MAAEEFALCFVEQVGGSIDDVRAWVSRIGESGIRAVRDTWNSLGAADKLVIAWIATTSASALGKILVKVFGIEAAEVLLLFLGGAAWGLMIGSLVVCADRTL